MNSPYNGKFRISQQYKDSNHDGFDMVGVDSKEIHSTVNGRVLYAGWENADNPKQGFGQYVKILRDDTNEVYYFGHLSELKVENGDIVRIGDDIGTEGHTGHCIPEGVGGNHLHYCCRTNGIRGQQKDISALSGIPNLKGTYDDSYKMIKDGTASRVNPYTEPKTSVRRGCKNSDDVKWVQWMINQKFGKHLQAQLVVDGDFGQKTLGAVKQFQIEIKRRYPSFAVDGIVGVQTRTKLKFYRDLS